VTTRATAAKGQYFFEVLIFPPPDLPPAQA